MWSQLVYPTTLPTYDQLVHPSVANWSIQMGPGGQVPRQLVPVVSTDWFTIKSHAQPTGLHGMSGLTYSPLVYTI